MIARQKEQPPSCSTSSRLPLLIHDNAMIPRPIHLASRRMRHGVLKNGREERHVDGVTFGDGSDDHAH
jgi:hypothetical protein